MNVGALLVVVLLLGLLGGWVIVTNHVITDFSLAPGLSWHVPVWLLALGGFAAGALFVLLLNLGSLASERSEASAAARALQDLTDRVSHLEDQLEALHKAAPGAAAEEEETNPPLG